MQSDTSLDLLCNYGGNDLGIETSFRYIIIDKNVVRFLIGFIAFLALILLVITVLRA